jgi:hypothetical protein
MADCRIEDNKCADTAQGNYGKCRGCNYTTFMQKVLIEIPRQDYHFIADQCLHDKYPVDACLAKLISMGVTDLKRAAKRLEAL